MTLDRVFGVSFALAILFIAPALVCLTLDWMFAFKVFFVLSGVCGMVELGSLALMELLDK